LRRVTAALSVLLCCYPWFEVWSFNLCWMWTGQQFFPSLDFLSDVAMEVAGGKLQSGWQLRMGCTPARSGNHLLVARGLIPHRQVIFDTVSWSASSTMLRRPWAALPLTSMAEGLLLRALASACWRHVLFNLSAGVPKGWGGGGALFCFSAACPNCSIPSGPVPSCGVDGRVSRHRPELGGARPDCFSPFSFRVLFANLESLCVIFTCLTPPLIVKVVSRSKFAKSSGL
jgi:hypothetical protein